MPKETTTKKTVTVKKSVTPVKTYIPTGTIENLVIVESPAKAKTISKYLGAGYQVRASMGHIVELAKKNMGIDMQDNFKPQYEVSASKKKVVTELKKLAKQANKVRLATDEDREGEAIAWHVAQQLKLDVKKTPRIVFHEITKTALESAVKNFRYLDMNLVNAQQGRRVLDRLVGFKISPILRTKIQRGLSAGRVQSVAVKLVIEKEREIKDFKPEESRKLLAVLKHKEQDVITEFVKLKGKNSKLVDSDSLMQYLKILGITQDSKETTDKKTGRKTLSINANLPFECIDVSAKEGKKTPPAPFTTSTLQQTASSKLGRGVKQVMMVAQKLYENGFITYMRTDSTNLSKDAISACQDFIISNFGKEYHHSRVFASKSANAQEAHEAIRPTNISQTPNSVSLTGNEQRLYDLIRRRTVACQMAEVKVLTTTYAFSLGRDDTWHTKGQVILFEGFYKVAGKPKEEETLPAIKAKEVLPSKHIVAEQHFSKPSPRYTEASLVKALESKGIGRPSTYAPTISTIIDRGYVEKIEKKLHPTDIAFVVNDFLEKFFSDLMDYEFTAHMEQKLDTVAEGKLERTEMMKEFYAHFLKELEKADDGKKEQTPVGRKCPECKEGNLVYKFGKMGKFIGCDRYPDCKYIEETQEKKAKIDDLKAKYEGQPCPAGGTIVVRMGRFGPFLSSSEYPEVKRIKAIPDPKIEALEEKFGGAKCELCKEGTMHIKKSRRGPFLACDRYPDCKNAKPLPKSALEEESNQESNETP